VLEHRIDSAAGKSKRGRVGAGQEPFREPEALMEVAVALGYPCLEEPV
jgi:hypothetical protein